MTGPGDSSLPGVQIGTVVAVDLVESFSVWGIRLCELLPEPWIMKSLAVDGSTDRVILEISVTVDWFTLERREELANILAGDVVDNIKCIALFVDFACIFRDIELSLVIYGGDYLRTVGILRLLYDVDFVRAWLQGRSDQVRFCITILSSLGVENFWMFI